MILPDFKQLDSSHAEATFPRSYLPYGLCCSDDLLGEEKRTDKIFTMFPCIGNPQCQKQNAGVINTTF